MEHTDSIMPPALPGGVVSSKAKQHGKLGFDFTAHMRLLVDDISGRIGELSHVDTDRMAIGFAQVRNGSRFGLQASVTPMRFENGQIYRRRRGRQWTTQKILNESGHECLYLLKFYLPRFLNQTFEEKLTTLFHELWHISPMFNGDLRRFEGRYYAHSGSQRRYDEAMRQLSQRWLGMRPPSQLYEFLRSDHAQLCHEHGFVFGMRLPSPKVIPARPPGHTARDRC